MKIFKSIKMVEIKAVQKVSLLDYPGKVSAIIFLGGCNFRCPFCYNVDIVLNPEKIVSIDEKIVLEFLKKRKKFLDGVCITGGEPTIHKDLPEFIRKIKALGLLVKLDTNGYEPEMLKKLLDKKLIDYVAMDIKTSLNKERYSKAAGINVDLSRIKKSIDLIRKSKVDYEFRTTVVPGLVNENDLIEIARALKGSKRYVLQQFLNDKKMIDKRFNKVKPYPQKVLEKFLKLVQPFFKEVELRA